MDGRDYPAELAAARETIIDLAERLYWGRPEARYSSTDVVLMARARAHGWRPWHERGGNDGYVTEAN